MRYASVCSGVEAASLAWMPLGWKPVFFSEIDPFPCAVLKERFPDVPNLGDMTKIKVENLSNGNQRFTNENGTDVIVSGGVDLLVGGTPCQGFSVAGKQCGLNDERSVLCLDYIELLKTMRPGWFVWENVPGVLSTNGGEDFKEFLRKIDEVGYSVAWRMLDAQYARVDGYPCAVPQRRRRVFVVGHIGDWQYPASVLFEPGCLLGDTPPRRINRKETAGNSERSIAGTGWGVVCAATGQVNAEITADRSPSLTCNHEAPIICLNDQGGSVMDIEARGIAGTLRANTRGNAQIICYAEESHAYYRPVKEVCISPALVARIGTGGNGTGAQEELAYMQNCSGVMGVATKTEESAKVRRLMPVEYERLMGFPDNWTQIPWRGKSAEDCPDSHRYKACGNSMCVNVMRWIGRRIEQVEQEKEKCK